MARVRQDCMQPWLKTAFVFYTLFHQQIVYFCLKFQNFKKIFVRAKVTNFNLHSSLMTMH